MGGASSNIINCWHLLLLGPTSPVTACINRIRQSSKIIRFAVFLASFAQEQTIVSRLLGIVVFLIGLGAIVLMYRPESSRYYEQESAPR